MLTIRRLQKMEEYSGLLCFANFSNYYNIKYSVKTFSQAIISYGFIVQYRTLHRPNQFMKCKFSFLNGKWTALT